VFGLLVRAAMIPLLVNLGAAIALVTAKNGFWFNHRLDGIPAPGFEYHMVLILVCLGLLFSGAGSFSLDKLIGGDSDEDYYYEDEYEDEEPAPGPL
jgi:putative oxidoreductase